MNDPVYESGVTPDSIVRTLSDLAEVFKGRLSYISVPLPIDGSAPVTHMCIKDTDIAIPASLNVGVKSPASRRSHNYNLRHTVALKSNDNPGVSTISDDTMDAIENTMEEYSIEDVEHFLDTPHTNVDMVKERTPEKTVSAPSRRRKVFA